MSISLLEKQPNKVSEEDKSILISALPLQRRSRLSPLCAFQRHFPNYNLTNKNAMLLCLSKKCNYNDSSHTTYTYKWQQQWFLLHNKQVTELEKSGSSCNISLCETCIIVGKGQWLTMDLKLLTFHLKYRF